MVNIVIGLFLSLSTLSLFIFQTAAIIDRHLAAPTMQFSLDRKRRSHKQNLCSASDSVGLIFTRSYHFTSLMTTPTTTPFLPGQN